MTNWSALDGLLWTDDRDGGCERTMELLHVYAELIVSDPQQARASYPDVVAHLDACGPCAEDLVGLLASIAPGERP